MSRGSHLENENKRLSLQANELKEMYTLTSSLNVKYKMQLQRETDEKEKLQELNQKLKVTINNMTAKCNELGQRVKILENSLARHSAVQEVPRVQMINSIADIVVSPPQSTAAFNDLQKRFDELEAEHQEALNVIDDLEFELGDVIARRLADGHKNFISPSCNFRSTTLKWKHSDCNKKTRS